MIIGRVCELNDNKTKVMELSPDKNQVDNVVVQGHTFEKVHQFTYLGVSINCNNDWFIELNSRKGIIFVKQIPTIYTVIIRPTLTYGCYMVFNKQNVTKTYVV